MRNLLNVKPLDIPCAAYHASGDLDGHPSSVTSYTDARLYVAFGPGSFALSSEAASELVRHLLAALSDCRTGSHDPDALGSLAVAARLLLSDAASLQKAAIQQLQREAKGVRHD